MNLDRTMDGSIDINGKLIGRTQDGTIDININENGLIGVDFIDSCGEQTLPEDIIPINYNCQDDCHCDCDNDLSSLTLLNL